MHRLTVGLTGGIGTGKSTALAAFARCGAATVSLDGAAHRLSRSGGAIHRAVRRAFGPRFLDPAGRVDRARLAAWAFSSRRNLRRLEALTHPPILREMRRALAAARKPVVVVDVPLLFEGRLASAFDLTVVVSAPEAAALRRAARRDGVTASAVARRRRAQLPLRRKEALADVVVANDGGRRALAKKISAYYKAFELIANG